MREISFVKRLKFNFNGSVTKNALVIGDADNDKQNELVCANLQGDLVIFKGKNPNRYAYAEELGKVTACVVGDVINGGKNYVAAINTEGLLFIFDFIAPFTWSNSNTRKLDSPNSLQVQSESASSTLTRGTVNATHNFDSQSTQSNRPNFTQSDSSAIKLEPLYDQRMPANCKELLLADLDGDGQNEVIVGLTDRVLRTYKWIKIGSDRGKFVGLYKWEFADQIGAVSLNPSQHENCQDIIVAQPGGTYAKLECFDKKPTTVISNSASSSSNEQKNSTDDTQQSLYAGGPADNSDNVRTEYISKLTPEYHQLVLSQMRNHRISTEVLGGIRDGKNSDSYSSIVIATLDGTLMLVNKDDILWSLQVDHQLFALAILESKAQQSKPLLSQSESTCTIVEAKKNSTSGNEAQFLGEEKSQYFVVCAWNGKTYIIDEERNYLRFKFDEAVSAFTAGNYHFDGTDHSSLVYATFNNQIVLYYDVILDQIRPMYLMNEILYNKKHADLLKKLQTLASKTCSTSGQKIMENDDCDSSFCESTMYTLLNSLLYSLKEDELRIQ